MLGLGGGLLHVWNHALFKPLLFFAAGSVIHSAGTREIDRLGGLARSMPKTAVLFCIAVLGICGLPPLNGFVSELMIYLGLFRTLGIDGGAQWPWAAFAPAALAMVGGLALACFVKAYGGVFLGTARTQSAAQSCEADRRMLGVMTALALGCLMIGLAPGLVIGLIGQAVASWARQDEVASAPLLHLVPSSWISTMGLATGALVAFGAVIYRRPWAGARQPRRRQGTWDCGYAMPVCGAPRIQYTASSFTQALVKLFRWALWPKRHLPAVIGRFPRGSHFKSHVPDAVLDRGILPAFRVAATFLPWVRLIQQGRVQVYVLYILAMLIGLLLWR
jgi:hydrogenase-4 component B